MSPLLHEVPQPVELASGQRKIPYRHTSPKCPRQGRHAPEPPARRIDTSATPLAKMLSRRLTSIISPPSPGINSKGAPTINVCGDEVPLEVYWVVLEMAETGHGKEEIAAQLSGRPDAKSIGSSTRIDKLIDNVLENQRLCKASGTILAVKHLHTSVPIGPAPKGRKSTMLQKARRVTTQISPPETTLRSPVSPEREEEKLVVEALRLAAERDALTRGMPDSNAKRRATATVDRRLKESLERHQLLDDNVASEDARTRIELARQNLN